ncbi:cell division regulator GpsB [Salisediminibacterium halotolerans]|uniref:DivIVA domain-containing protein n=1 Tax=Salisediminibacterium halotolerans TaxID=517425 RepID=A0A1H9RVV0_9BACI|nr:MULTISPECIES: cell division regulator GpsB [Salisediminibacterium]RLJ74079.1 DivIVA domain-containing protein [Actinophytocola xinjiangensis]RPE87828.1 DivIVA domain-containing protein [Salisediminibacterium halotolerans]TWG34916.1 DivIVA domain-containing protein [Salisediminibacterium halotolerans]SER76039.1 DivIVA domain-containing protein [Salisediminibacterium haloalkalitolerans]GEL07897.1 cell cycle protein GpsB [Salisediminibacterium halotolerans]
MDKKQIANLSRNDIYEKEFKSSMRGYNQDDVDQFLDEVIKDYEAFENRIKSLEQENESLKEELAAAREKVKQQPPKEQSENQPSPGNTNYDILRRVSNLEKHVFGSKLYE